MSVTYLFFSAEATVRSRTLSGTKTGHSTSGASCYQELVAQSDSDLYRASDRSSMSLRNINRAILEFNLKHVNRFVVAHSNHAAARNRKSASSVDFDFPLVSLRTTLPES